MMITSMKGMSSISARNEGIAKKYTFDLIHRNMDRVIEDKEKGEGRKHLVVS